MAPTTRSAKRQHTDEAPEQSHNVSTQQSQVPAANQSRGSSERNRDARTSPENEEAPNRREHPRSDDGAGIQEIIYKNNAGRAYAVYLGRSAARPELVVDTLPDDDSENGPEAEPEFESELSDLSEIGSRLEALEGSLDFEVIEGSSNQQADHMAAGHNLQNKLSAEEEAQVAKLELSPEEQSLLQYLSISALVATVISATKGPRPGPEELDTMISLLARKYSFPYEEDQLKRFFQRDTGMIKRVGDGYEFTTTNADEIEKFKTKKKNGSKWEHRDPGQPTDIQKPEGTYVDLLKQAIRRSSTGLATPSEVFKNIMDAHEFYKAWDCGNKVKWKGAVRATMSKPSVCQTYTGSYYAVREDYEAGLIKPPKGIVPIPR